MKPTKSEIRKVIEKMLLYSFIFAKPRHKQKPGEIIRRMKPEDREILKHATADDFGCRAKDLFKETHK